jgi:hypothetical protein
MRKAIALSACFLLLTSTACKKEGEINPDFIEDSSSSNFLNEFEITAQVKSVDTILTDEIANGLVGVYRDSAFGTTRAEFYIQPQLASNFQVYYDVGDIYITDSVVLSLPYISAFGDTSQSQIEVYRLDEELEKSTVYYSDDSVRVIPAILGSKTFTPDLSKNVVIARPNLAGFYDTLTLDPQLRISLDNSLGDEILSKSGQSEVENNDNFTAFFKGLKVQAPQSLQPLNNQGNILTLALTNSQSLFSIYYKVIDGNGDTTNRVIEYPINTNSVRFANYKNSFTNSAVGSIIDDDQEDSLFLYSSGMAGVQTEIKFPNLASQFANQSIVVNRAELFLPLAEGSYSRSGVADQLILASKDANGDLNFLPDFFEGSTYFGGEYDPSRNAYVFGISRYIQSIISGKSDSEALVILVDGSAVTPERAVIFGPAQSTQKIRLNLYYSNTLE